MHDTPTLQDRAVEQQLGPAHPQHNARWSGDPRDVPEFLPAANPDCSAAHNTLTAATVVCMTLRRTPPDALRMSHGARPQPCADTCSCRCCPCSNEWAQLVTGSWLLPCSHCRHAHPQFCYIQASSHQAADDRAAAAQTNMPVTARGYTDTGTRAPPSLLCDGFSLSGVPHSPHYQQACSLDSPVVQLLSASR
jgi:hypothetical protein